ncbi:hypothetical protein [Streptomyces sp. NBC_00439]|uniref:hypothetical protein n=1 Tax=Streptomyces sp. NBC_00439 TaxID=2903650 RepID=UPI0022572D46|nr:hypothetical protein [Streptomyces sp. NBC_00439]
MLETIAPEADEDYDSINLMQLIESAIAALPARQRSFLLLRARNTILLKRPGWS